MIHTAQRSPFGARMASRQKQWTVLRTRSRQEKAVSRCLAARNVEHYLPLIERITRIQGRRAHSRVPLFPGYVFYFGELDDGYDIMATKRACELLPVHDQDRFAHELGQIRRALVEGAQLELYPFAVVGRRCRVRKGPFRGIEGVVVDRRGNARLILHVDILGRGAALDVDADLLESCD